MVSGLTVMISLAGLLLTGIDLFTGIAVGTIMVVGVAVVGSLTVLPALLSLLGPWADRGRIPFLGRPPDRGPAVPAVGRPGPPGGPPAAALGRRWPRWRCWRWPPPRSACAPAARPSTCRRGLPVVRTLDQIQQAFPGRPAPAAGGGDRPATCPGPPCGTRWPRCRPGRSARGRDPPAGHRASVVGGGRGLVISVPLAGNGKSDAVSCTALLDAARARSCPPPSGPCPGVSYAVTGNTASGYDFSAALRSRTPIVFAVVAALALLLLMVAFRSLVIPLVSIGLNLLSVGAAYGLITLIFQDGHLQGLLGFTSFGAIIPWVPLFMFVFLFGLSMDYHVFILSRIRELRSGGQASTGTRWSAASPAAPAW